MDEISKNRINERNPKRKIQLFRKKTIAEFPRKGEISTCFSNLKKTRFKLDIKHSSSNQMITKDQKLSDLTTLLFRSLILLFIA